MGEWDLGDIVEVVLDFMGFNDELGDYVDESMDENALQDAIDESIMEMEAMASNAGQESIIENEVIPVWEDNCYASLRGGTSPARLTRADIGDEYYMAVHEIIQEGEAIVMDAIDA